MPRPTSRGSSRGRFADFKTATTELQQQWEWSSIIHGDLKFTHVLVNDTDQGQPRVKLVDWEFATVGDPAWDVAGWLQSYLDAWVAAMPVDPAQSPAAWIGGAQTPLESMWPQIRAFWEAYSSTRDLNGPAAASFLDRAVAFAAIRLVQTAFEQTLAAQALTSRSTVLLQLGLNILQSPSQGARELYGLP